MPAQKTLSGDNGKGLVFFAGEHIFGHFVSPQTGGDHIQGTMEIVAAAVAIFNFFRIGTHIFALIVVKGALAYEFAFCHDLDP